MATNVMHYDPTDSAAVAMRSEVRDVLLHIARAHASLGDCAQIEIDLFNDAFNHLFRRAQLDPEVAALAFMELVFAADRGAVRLAAMHGCSVETALRQVIP